MLRNLRPLIAVTVLVASAACSSDKVVAPPVVSRLEMTATTQTISPAQKVKVTVYAYGADNTLLESAPLLWSTSAIDVATVDEGYVTGVAPGTAIIRVSSGTIASTIQFTVIRAAGTLATLVVSTVDNQLELSQGSQATVSGRDSRGDEVALGTRVVTWTSSNVNVATVSNAGGVNTVGIGTATITASVPDGSSFITGSTQVTVVPIPNAPISADVAMEAERFIPAQSVVKLGGTVRFQFTSIPHNVIWTPRKAGAPDDILVTRNTLVTRVFSTVGVYPFICTVHPGMSGEIVVTP